MTMSPYGPNPIELKKQQVRRDARNAVVCVGVGAAGVVLGALVSTTLLVLGLVVAVAGGAYYGSRIRKAISKDPNARY